MSGFSLATKLGRKVGMDRAVGFAVLSRGWAAVTGILTLALLVRFLSPQQQGYYSTFGSFMGIQVFFELGLSVVLLQFASHERAGLEWSAAGTLEGDPIHKARLASLLRRGLLWYGAASLLVLLVIFPIGYVFFHGHPQPGAPVAWQGPWTFLSAGLAVGLLFTPLWAILEGCGLVAEVIRAQFVAAVLNSFLFWMMLCGHWGLYAAPLGGIASAVWVVAYLSVRQRRFLADLLRSARPEAAISWRHEIWPFQWRLALSWLSGYFIYQTFVPILFAAHGSVSAGQMGLSLSTTSAIAAVALTWVSTKAAPFGRLVALRDWAQMDRLFFPALWQSTTLLVLGETSFWLVNLYLHQHAFAHRLSVRLLDPLPMGMLMAATVSSHVVAAEAVYLRSHKREPFLVQSLLAGGTIAGLSWLLGRPFGAVGMMAGYLAVSLSVGVGMGTYLFVRKRREWHSDPPAGPLPPAATPVLEALTR